MNQAGGGFATTHGGGDGAETGLFQVCDATPGVCHNLGDFPGRAPIESCDDEQGIRAGTEEDDRPPICPACGVTMGIAVEGRGVRYVCLECGFSEDGADR